MIIPSQKHIDRNEFKAIQMDILEEVHDFCSKAGLQYFLSGGTLVGAIRHAGYIPWDDDIDIAMPRPDFNRFMAEFTCVHLQVRHCGNRSGVLPFIQICDNRTALRFAGETYTGKIWIDVFPLDGLPRNKFFRLLYRKFHQFLLGIIQAKPTPWRHFICNGYWRRHVIEKLVACCFSQSALGKIRNKYIQMCDYSRATSIAMLSEMSNSHFECPKEWFSSTIKVSFEGRAFYVPAGYDPWLRQKWGDYMTPPPEELRYSHGVIDAYWK